MNNFEQLHKETVKAIEELQALSDRLVELEKQQKELYEQATRFTY